MNRRALATLLLPLSVWAGPYKCLQPDGSVVYQETRCAIGTEGGELALDPPPPSSHAGKGKDYSIEGQVKAMEAQRNKARKERARAAAQARPAAKKKPGYDRAKCAKNRAEVARWTQKTHSTYRDIGERDYREQKLEYHQALVDQYCRPD
jgi:hypothetical protein